MLISGKSYWTKIIGEPRKGYEDDPVPEWSMDVALTPESAKALRDAGCTSYVKNKGDDRGDFVSLKRKALKQDGTPAKPIKVVDAHNNDWNKRLIGNGSTVNVSIALNERTYKGKKFLKPSILAVQVWDLVEYQPKESFPTRTEEDFPKDETKDW
jgi:hypothetical protein